MLTVYTFGDSILDCAHFNDHGVDPGRLLVKNDDALFPDFRGRDLSSKGPARLEYRAYDGSIVEDLPDQTDGLVVEGPSIALLTIGGNDLLSGLLDDRGPGIEVFDRKLGHFLQGLPIRPVLIGNVYDPTFGNDAQNVFGVDPSWGRENHRRVNAVLAELARTYGALVDLHHHFLRGKPDWFTRTIEPSLAGALEVRRCFLETIEAGGFI
jgi:lysophospholipase L1-like esterase